MSETQNLPREQGNNKKIGKISYYNENTSSFSPAVENSETKNIKENNLPKLQERSRKGSSRKASSIEDKKENQEQSNFNAAYQEKKNLLNKKNELENKSKEYSDKLSNDIPNDFDIYNNANNAQENYEKLKEEENNIGSKNENIRIKENNISFTNVSNINNRFENVSNDEAMKNQPYNFNNISNVVNNNYNCNTNSTFNLNYHSNKFDNLAQKHISQNNYSFNFQKKKDFNLTLGEVGRIYKIFKIIAEGERQVELVRQVLSEISRFDPFATFKYFDVDGKNFLTKNDFQNYLKKNKISYETDHTKMIVSSYDADHDDRLTYSDFINMVVTAKDPILKQLAFKYSKTSKLKEIEYNFNSKLADPIENNLVKFFLREMDLFRNLNNFIKEIRNDYNEITFISNLFAELDFENQNYFREEHLNFFFQICEKNFDIRNLKINFCASDIKAIFNRLDINKDGKIHYWELKNFFKFRDYSKISGLDDIEYRAGPSHYSHQPSILTNKTPRNDSDKNLLEHKYPSGKANLNSNYKNNNNNNSLNLVRFSSKNSCNFNFNDIHNEIEQKIGSINKLILHDKSKQSQLDNQVKFITESENVRKFIGNEIDRVNNPNLRHDDVNYPNTNVGNNNDNINNNNNFNNSENYNQAAYQIKRTFDSHSTKKYLNINNNLNHNNNAYSQNNSRKASGNLETYKNPEIYEHNSNNNKSQADPKSSLSPSRSEKLNKSRQFSSSKFGISNFEEIKSNNTHGIKLNLEEEIFLQFLIDTVQLNKESEAIKNELARRFDFSIIKLFKIFQEAEEENEVFQQEKNSFKPNYYSPIGEFRERSNYPNTFNLTNKFNNTSKSFGSYKNNIDEEKQQNNYNNNQSFNLSYMRNFPIGRKSKENTISKFAFKKTLNGMEIYPTLIELKLMLNRFNNKEADFSFANFCFMFLPFDEAYRKIMNIQNNYNFSYNLENDANSASYFSPETENLLVKLLKKLISNENKIEIWRNKLNKMQMFSVKNTFSKMIDNRMPETRYAFITKMDLNYYFNHIYNISYHSINLREDVDMIIQIFDKDKDGKISFNEFVDEIFPQVSEMN